MDSIATSEGGGLHDDFVQPTIALLLRADAEACAD